MLNLLELDDELKIEGEWGERMERKNEKKWGMISLNSLLSELLKRPCGILHSTPFKEISSLKFRNPIDKESEMFLYNSDLNYPNKRILPIVIPRQILIIGFFKLLDNLTS